MVLFLKKIILKTNYSLISHLILEKLQKYLLATGLIQDSVQQSLDMIVTNGGFNDATVRR